MRRLSRFLQLSSRVSGPDLAKALKDDPEAKAAFDDLPFGLKRKHVAAIEEAKTAEVRKRRIVALVSRMQSAHN